LADFWELLALRSSSRAASLADVHSAISKHAEVDAGDDAEADIAEEGRLSEATKEIVERMAACGARSYPFAFDEDSEHVLEAKPWGDEKGFWLYGYLLLATRLNMNDRANLDGVNGPLLFEEVCEAALRNLGGRHAVIHRFGTSAGETGFAARLARFFTAFDESPLRTDRRIPNHGGDDGLDLAWWTTFSWHSATPWRNTAARPPGKLIVLAQCKTGTSWDEVDLNRLQPGSFFKKWMQRQPLGQTNRAFMVAGRVTAQEMEDYQADCLFFDRCRVMDYATEMLSEELFGRVKRWTTAALQSPDFRR